MTDPACSSPLIGPVAFPDPNEIDLEAGPSEQFQCRICLETDGRDFIAPCKCKGTSKFVHRECLDHWRAVKVSAQMCLDYDVPGSGGTLCIWADCTTCCESTGGDCRCLGGETGEASLPLLLIVGLLVLGLFTVVGIFYSVLVATVGFAVTLSTVEMAAVESVQCFGRKKTAVAVAHCKRGRGLIKVNGVPIELVKPEILRLKAFEPVLLLGRQRFMGVDLRIRVRGGGKTSQIYAIRQSIAKALVAFHQKYVDEQSKKEIKDILVRYDRTLLVADPRRCEPKKFGGRGARARFQKSYR
ncbi:hypothetical protein BHE74_00029479 [Ensete ventricosum]|nr:hypothetical protein BHE74_00029479 [Ensete ventricosum]RZR89345.1 hypothetical protein BHM03_00017047 [Ensete ventricosum]